MSKKKKVKVFLPDGAKTVEELTDKQLKNIAHYNNLSKKEKENVIKNTARSAALLSIPSAATGAFIANKRTGKGALIGGGIGVATAIGMGISGHRLHKKQADAAEKELQKRKQKKFSVLMTEEEVSLFSEFIKEQREFGEESAILGVVSPGSWNAKEAAKYAYEDDPEG